LPGKTTGRNTDREQSFLKVRYELPLILCLLILLPIPLVSGDTVSASLSTGAGTPETPPMSVSSYINDTKAAVAERNWTEALFLTTQGTTWYPDNADLLSIQGYSYRKMGYYEKSVNAASQGILLDPKPVRYANRGYGYLALRNYTAVLADAETGISVNATYSTTYGVKALALQGMARNTEALASIDRALALEPGNAHYWHVKGMLLTADHDCAGARDAFGRSLELDPDYDLPYTGFPDARGSLAALNTTCTPASPLPSPTKSPACCGIAIVGIVGALLIFGMRK
jgi:tetratricopeptide (TPR) repeat protein